MRNHDSASLPLLDNRHDRCIEDGFGVDPVGAVKIQGISRMAEITMLIKAYAARALKGRR